MILLSSIQVFEVHLCKLGTNSTHGEANKKLPINYKGNWSNSGGTSVHPANFEINQGGERGTSSNKNIEILEIIEFYV